MIGKGGRQGGGGKPLHLVGISYADGCCEQSLEKNRRQASDEMSTKGREGGANSVSRSKLDSGRRELCSRVAPGCPREASMGRSGCRASSRFDTLASGRSVEVLCTAQPLCPGAGTRRVVAFGRTSEAESTHVRREGGLERRPVRDGRAAKSEEPITTISTINYYYYYYYEY